VGNAIPGRPAATDGPGDGKALRRATVRGGAAVALGQGTGVVLSMVSTAIMARLLVRADFGLVAMATAFSGFVAMFRDFGLSAATVQHRDLTQEQMSGLFWINVAVSVLLGALLAAAAPLVAAFYGDERLTAVTMLIALTFPVSGLGVQHDAMMRRRMMFGRLAAGTICAQLCGIAAGVATAMAGWGYKALVASMLVSGAAQTTASWILGGWRPGRPAPLRDLTKSLKFGAAVSGTAVLAYIHRNLDNVIVGRVAGDEALGLYSKAYGLVLLPLRQIQAPISSVSFSALARLQKDEAAYKAFYGRVVELAFSAMWFAVGLSVAAADEIVRVLLGPQWGDAAGIFRLLAPATYAGVTYFASGIAYQTLGHVGRQTIVTAATTPFVVAAFLVGVQWGVPGVAIAFSAYSVLVAGPVVVAAYRGTFLRVRDFVAISALPLASSLVACGAAWSANLLVDPLDRIVVALASKMVVFAAAWLLVWRLWPGGWARLMAMAGTARHFRGERAAAKTTGEPKTP